MGELGKVLYIVVVDEEGRDERKNSFRYTRPVLQSTLQFMGCKARHAFKISRRVFMLARTEKDVRLLKDEFLGVDCSKGNSCFLNNSATGCYLDEKDVGSNSVSVKNDKNIDLPFELYKRRTTIMLRRETFSSVISYALAEYKYVGPNQKADIDLSCRIRERKKSITILMCGTSGCGKSTLSALLGGRLGLTTVISTDSIRHMMRSFVDEKKNPLLWASTYHAGEFLDPVAVAEAMAKRKAKKEAAVTSSNLKVEAPGSIVSGNNCIAAGIDSAVSAFGSVSLKQMAIEGYKAQSEMVIDSLDRLITAWEERKESVIVEGVHLSLNFVMGLMKKHPSIIPFMIYITNEEKHLERFAVRAKYMTLDPAKNKYVKYIRNIRTIQEYLCERADKHLVPKINNTNVDKSVAAIHAMVFGCLRRLEAGEQLYDPATNTVPLIYEEYRNQCAVNSLNSKGMFQLIQRKGSTRHLMALLNVDGSVAKAWPVESPENGHDADHGGCVPMYGPLQIGKAEPVNLQFGSLGISAWPCDGGTSRTGSVDESRGDGTDTGSRLYSSCCSSPRMPDVLNKELKEEYWVHGSDEEVDDPSERDTDEDLSEDSNKNVHDHDEIGSVDEESTKSDEEYEDLALQDIQENCLAPDNEEQKSGSLVHVTSSSSSPSESPWNVVMHSSGHGQIISHSVGIPVMGNQGALVSVAPF